MIWEAPAHPKRLLRSNPPTDGNKRIALSAMYPILVIQGWQAVSDPDETRRFMVDLYDQQYFHLSAWVARLRVNTRRHVWVLSPETRPGAGICPRP